jgi:hypothetical protein
MDIPSEELVMTKQPPGSGQAIRLIFEYEGDTVRLVSQQPVDVAIPRFAPTDERAGHFVETRTDAGSALARIPVHGGFVQSAEVFPEDHSEEITRVDTEPRGAFTVVVPANQEAVQIAVMRAGATEANLRRSRGLAAPADESADVELGSFPLEQGR